MRIAVVTVALALTALVAGCGSSGQKIPQSNASDLIARLQEADRKSGGQPDCTGLNDSTLPALEAGLAALPKKTDKDIRDTLKEGIDNLRSLVEAKCTQTTTTSSSSSSTATSTSSATSTPPPTSTSTTTQTTTTAPPPSPPTSSSSTTSTNPSGGAPPGQAKKGNGG